MECGGLPLLAWPAICVLDRFLEHQMNVFEWGSGGSTVFLARRVAHLTSIEHDPVWFQKTTKSLERNALRCNLLLRPPIQTDPPYSGDDKSTVKLYKGLSFHNYVGAIDCAPDESFHAIIVDGRARKPCLKHACPKLVKGGLLVLDNADRGEYKDGMTMIEWPVTVFESSLPYHPLDVKVTTAIWKKP